MAKHTHTTRKKINTALKRSDNIDAAVNVLVALATNKAEEYGHKSVPATVMAKCATKLLEMGIDVEKQLEEINKEKSSDNDEDGEVSSSQSASVVVLSTAE